MTVYKLICSSCKTTFYCLGHNCVLIDNKKTINGCHCIECTLQTNNEFKNKLAFEACPKIRTYEEAMMLDVTETL